MTLGVSHPSLEAIRARTAEPYGLSTKLTGAGGGGCAVTLLPDGISPSFTPFLIVADSIIDFKSEDLQRLVEDLIRENYEPYISSVGGSGLGILSPYPEHRNREVISASGSQTRTHVQTDGQVTPPETPAPDRQAQLWDGSVGDKEAETLCAPFKTTSIDHLSEWASGLGRWLYV